MPRRLVASVFAGVMIVSMRAVSAGAQTAREPPASAHRAIAITPDGHAVLRDDGLVIAFANKSKKDDGSDPVLVQGLKDIVDIAGQTAGMGPLLPRESALWIALARDGTVYQWTGQCAKAGQWDCRYTKATQVPGLKNIAAISSGDGVHFAVDRDGQAWGWGWDMRGVIGGPPDQSRGNRWPLVSSPVRIPVPGLVRSITVGSSPHALAIDTAGAVWIWDPDVPTDALPENTETITAGQMTFTKVAGLPPARSAASATGTLGGGTSYVVTETDDVWSWGIIKINGAETAGPRGLSTEMVGTRQPHRIEGVCPAASLSIAREMAIALCRDGSIFKQSRISLPGQMGAAWEKEQSAKDVLSVHIEGSPFNVVLIDRSGAAWRGTWGNPRLAGPLASASGPLKLDPSKGGPQPARTVVRGPVALPR
jgi:alpha-tubulin suppressor-like RCC1 family protein